MGKILKQLFQCDLSFPQREDLRQQYSASLDDILRGEESVKRELSPAHWSLVIKHLEKIQKHHDLDVQLQFERGFICGFQLLVEMLERGWNT